MRFQAHEAADRKRTFREGRRAGLSVKYCVNIHAFQVEMLTLRVLEIAAYQWRIRGQVGEAFSYESLQKQVLPLGIRIILLRISILRVSYEILTVEDGRLGLIVELYERRSEHHPNQNFVEERTCTNRSQNFGEQLFILNKVFSSI
jgi:hypothetical protein